MFFQVSLFFFSDSCLPYICIIWKLEPSVLHGTILELKCAKVPKVFNVLILRGICNIWAARAFEIAWYLQHFGARGYQPGNRMILELKFDKLPRFSPCPSHFV